MYLHFTDLNRIYAAQDVQNAKGKFVMQHSLHSYTVSRLRGTGTVLVSLCCQSLWLPPVSHQWCKSSSCCPSVEQVQSRDGGFFGFLDLRFGQFDPAHGNHSTDGKVSRNAAHTKPERPVQTVVQNNQYKEVLPMIGNQLGQTVVPHGCQETQHAQGSEESWRNSQGRRISSMTKGN